MELSVPKSRLVVCAGKDVSFIPLVPNSAPTHTLTLPQAPSSASLHPTLGDRFVAGSTDDPWVRVYDLENGEEREVYKGHHGPVHCIEYSPDGEMYASGSGRLPALYCRLNSAGFLIIVMCLRGRDDSSLADIPWSLVRALAGYSRRKWRLVLALVAVLTTCNETAFVAVVLTGCLQPCIFSWSESDITQDGHERASISDDILLELHNPINGIRK